MRIVMPSGLSNAYGIGMSRGDFLLPAGNNPIWNGENVALNKSDINMLLKLKDELENEELNWAFVNFSLASEKISIENLLSRLRTKARLGLHIAEELHFAASNFSELPTSDLRCLSVSVLERILAHESFQIENENWLLDLVCELVSDNESYSPLFKYIQFWYLDSKHISRFFETIYPKYVDGVLWKSITKFISSSVRVSSQNRLKRKRFKKLEVFEYDKSNPMKGILSYLREESGGNRFPDRVVNIRSSDYKCYDCDRVIDHGWNSWIVVKSADESSYGDPMPWIQFDFGDIQISLESYTIKSDGSHNNHIRGWKIEGSDNASSWINLHTINTNDLNGDFLTKHYKCEQTEEHFYRYIRLTSTVSSVLLLSEIEFFGKVRYDTRSGFSSSGFGSSGFGSGGFSSPIPPSYPFVFHPENLDKPKSNAFEKPSGLALAPSAVKKPAAKPETGALASRGPAPPADKPKVPFGKPTTVSGDVTTSAQTKSKLFSALDGKFKFTFDRSVTTAPDSLGTPAAGNKPEGKENQFGSAPKSDLFGAPKQGTGGLFSGFGKSTSSFSHS